MRFAENKILWLSVAALVVAAGILVWIFVSVQPFRLVVLFNEVGHLKKDDPVVWKDFAIGKVTDIRPLVDNQIGVTIELKEDYASEITRGTEFYLKPGPLMGILGSDSIEVITPASPGAPFANGEKVQGKPRPKASILEIGKQWTLEQWRQLKDQTGLLIEEFQKSPYRGDIEDALRQLQKITEEGVRQAGEQAEEFRKTHEKELESIRKKLERIRNEMRRKGEEADAKRLDKQLEKLNQS